jgi:hypothetical protein
MELCLIKTVNRSAGILACFSAMFAKFPFPRILGNGNAKEPPAGVRRCRASNLDWSKMAIEFASLPGEFATVGKLIPCRNGMQPFTLRPKKIEFASLPLRQGSLGKGEGM